MLEVNEVLNPDCLPAKPMKFPEKLMFKIVLKAFFKNESWTRMSLVVEHLPSVYKALGAIPSVKNAKQNKINHGHDGAYL